MASKRFLYIALLLIGFLFFLTVLSVGASPRLDTYNQVATYDTFIRSDQATTNFGTSTACSVGESNGGTGVVRRCLLRFDLSSIPSNAVVSSAVLSLWVSSDVADNARTYDVFILKRPFVETEATWNIYTTGFNWGAAGASDTSDYFTTPIGSASFTASEAVGTEKQFSLDLSSLITGAVSNYGLIVRAQTETNDGYNFYSSEEVTETAKLPKLVVSYTVPTATPIPTSTPSVVTSLGSPGDIDFDFWYYFLFGFAFLALKMYWQGVFFVFISPYLFRYNIMIPQTIAVYFILSLIVQFFHNLGSGTKNSVI